MENKMKEIIILVGNIGSGKSTLAKEYAKKGYVVISRDSFRYMIGAGTYRFDFKTEPFIKKSAIATLKTFLKSGYNLVYDEVNVSKKLRTHSIQLAKQFDYKIIVVKLPRLAKQISVDRRMRNPHGQPDRNVWNRVWEMFDEIYEEPTIKEGINKIIKVR
jgi:predicted kinase